MLKFDIKDVYSWSNAGEAKQYINKEGYFSDDLDELNREINENKLYPLKEVNSNSAICFVALSPVGKWSCGLFIPADKVKAKEKKWRPFNCIEEVFVTYNKDVGSFITYRTKDFPLRTITTTITGYAKEKNKEDQIQIGAGMIELSNCFEGIEIWNKNEWQPFGVEE